ncbi:MAG: SLBB domain-containing protein [Phycisphaeraceae bacterium]|nr:SLBB domain-containing protein [Phycisphaeraceae bacterium]
MSSTTVQQIESCGVVGAGGAGFPTHVKLSARADTVLLNAAECEPLLHKDKELLRHFSRDVLDGLEIARQLVGAGQAIVGIKGKYADVIASLRPMLNAQTTITALSDSYPSGDEFILVYDCTQRLVPPGQIPLAVGCVVINVETALNIAQGKPVTQKYLTVAGAVKNPVTICVPVGCTFAHCIELAGGATCEEPFALVGGVMMGKLCTDFTQVVTRTTGGLIVLPKSHSLYRRYAAEWKQIARIGASACDQCSFCTEFCPRYLLGHPIEPHKAMRSLCFNEIGEANIAGTDFCCECNLCTMMACPEDLDPKNVCTQNKRRRAAEKTRWQNPPLVEARPRLHLDNRRVPIGRLIRKLGLSDFTNTGPYQQPAPPPSKVNIPLQMHVGAPAEPTVKVGDSVRVGDVIAKPLAGKLGVPIHASIAGRVTAVNGSIAIES